MPWSRHRTTAGRPGDAARHSRRWSPRGCAARGRRRRRNGADAPGASRSVSIASSMMDQHLVESAPEPAQLGVLVERRHPLPQVAGGDGGGRVDHLVHRPHGPPHRPPGGCGPDHQDHDPAEQQGADQRGGRGGSPRPAGTWVDRRPSRPAREAGRVAQAGSSRSPSTLTRSDQTVAARDACHVRKPGQGSFGEPRCLRPRPRYPSHLDDNLGEQAEKIASSPSTRQARFKARRPYSPGPRSANPSGFLFRLGHQDRDRIDREDTTRPIAAIAASSGTVNKVASLVRSDIVSPAPPRMASPTRRRHGLDGAG